MLFCKLNYSIILVAYIYIYKYLSASSSAAAAFAAACFFSLIRIDFSGAIQIPGSQGWFLAASSRTKILAKNYSKSALIAEKASKMIVER
jgi:hypothetical protein